MLLLHLPQTTHPLMTETHPETRMYLKMTRRENGSASHQECSRAPCIRGLMV